MRSIDIADAEAMVKLLATAADPTITMPIAERRRNLLEKLGRLVDADVWIWVISKQNPALRGDAMVVNLIDGGWLNEWERADLFRAMSHPQLMAPAQGLLWDAMNQQRSLTMSRDQITEATPPSHRAEFGKAWHATGFDQSIISAYPIGEGMFSGMGFHRRLGKPAFSQRECTIVHVMIQQIDWLHRAVADVPAASDIVSLSPRERQVTMLLMGGDSLKQVAAKLRLSQHTVADYLKEIYRKLRVNSRAELLAKFIPSGK